MASDKPRLRAPLPGPSDALEAEAARWLARRERGFTPEEEAQFAAWKARGSGHGAAVARLAQAWNSLDRLRALAPPGARQPDPDLLGSSRRPRALRFSVLAAAASVAAVLSIAIWRGSAPSGAPSTEVSAPTLACRHMALPDGSVADLKGDSAIEVQFTPSERRIRLIRGEANFSVEKDPTRPFFVVAGVVVVRAVGTVFDVSMQPERVAVLVTEGKVGVAAREASSASPQAPTPLPIVGAGQLALIPAGGEPMELQDVSVGEIDRLLAWQGKRLEFVEKSLEDVVADLNRRNERKLVIGDPEIGRIQIGGNFRADNIDAFVRLLEAGFGISAENRDSDTITLRKAH